MATAQELWVRARRPATRTSPQAGNGCGKANRSAVRLNNSVAGGRFTFDDLSLNLSPIFSETPTMAITGSEITSTI